MAKTVKKGSTVVVIGTKKGAFLFHSADRRRWSRLGPYFEGNPVYHATLDPRDGRTVYAGATSEHWGPTVHRARVGGEFERGNEAPKFPEGSNLAVTRIWHIEPGHPDEEGTLYVGVEPAGLFRSDDRGDRWRSLDALNLHPSRTGWEPGNGGLCLHSVLVDPNDPSHLVVGISAVGAWESRDAGVTWTVENRGVRADFLPDKYPEMGQCVHKLAWDAAADGSVFQQNHCGMYHRGAADHAWTEVSAGLPSTFGFPIVAHPRRKGTAYVVPLVGDFNRVPPKGQLAVWRTRDAGRTWRRLTRGLPGPGAYMVVLREGLAADGGDPLGLYLGTNTGELYGSRDEGESWKPIAAHLPAVLSVSASEVR